MDTPQSTKNSRAKYSPTCSPTFSMSLPLSRKNNNVLAKTIAKKVRLKLLVLTMSKVSILINELPEYNSMAFKINKSEIPKRARYLGVDFDLTKTPLNIITIPQIAENIIAFIIRF
jgi:hypothetical protein